MSNQRNISMPHLAAEALSFAAEREQGERAARQLAALRLLCGIDMPLALRQTGETRRQTIRRVRRIVERERLRGACGHADYDLDRHIALSQSLDRLTTGQPKGDATNRNGARRRRQQ